MPARLHGEAIPCAAGDGGQAKTRPPAVAYLGATETLDGGAVLPGLALPVGELFAELDRQAKA
ncbi:MAG: hypothetical protein HZA54_01250 [Planctomycetes bacterium]|nr:hypothetical protein [Planctomycetota bacterium]